MAELDEAAIFNAARKIDLAEDRQAYLSRACGGDPLIYERLATMLRVYDADRNFLESPPSDLSPTLDNSPIDARPGTVIDRYKLVKQIGEGGFAVVFMARQTEPIQRNIALKIIKLGMDTRQVIARFEAERQTLAMMDHPGIAKVYDAGATESGRPYFVMELIDGIPITEFCDLNGLTIAARLQLFLGVCHAVEHAHQKGIIHRDIKPTNVLVTVHDGQPVSKVIDFGIAKATHQRLTEKTLYTSHHEIIGTPQYMSPEQAEFTELDIDTRSDIYSLGVLLYELMTSTTPLPSSELQRMRYDEICRAIIERDTPMPSRRLSALGNGVVSASGSLQSKSVGSPKRLSGDLDWIVMRALEKDRTRRYQTADSLASDIQRHLVHEPVHARPPSTAYQVRKLAQKHRGKVFAAGAILATIVVALIMSIVGLVRINEERKVANRQRDRAEENLRLTGQLIREVLVPASDQLEFDSDAERAAHVKALILKQAIAFSQQVLEQSPTDPKVRLEIAQLCNRLTNLSFLNGEHEEATYRRSISTLEGLVAEFPENATYQLELATAQAEAARLSWAQLRWQDSAQHYRKRLKILNKLVNQFVNETKYRAERDKSYGELAYAFQKSGDLAQAESHYRDALRVERLSGAMSRQRYADFLMSKNRFDDARIQLEMALETTEQKRPDSAWGSSLNDFWKSLVLNELAAHSTSHARPGEAVEFLQRCLGIGKLLSHRLGHSPFQANVLGWTYYELGESFVQNSQLDEAERATRQALTSWQSARGRMTSHNAALAYYRLGQLLYCGNDLDQARSNFALAVERLEEVAGELPDEASCQQRLILLLANCPDHKFRDPQRAVRLAKRVITDSNGPMWRYLALSQYRCRAWLEAEEAIQKSMQLRGGGDAMDWIILAMAQWQSDQQPQASQMYASAEEAISAGRPIFYGEVGVSAFQGLRAEAAAMLRPSTMLGTDDTAGFDIQR